MGQIVAPKSNPSLRGVIVGITPGKPENRFLVFLEGKTIPYYASQLQAQKETGSGFEILPLAHFHAYLTALQIHHPGLSTLYSLNAARVDFIPYQFRPVLKFIRSDRPRLLIADSVGIGKTIEAGLILRELQARRDIKSVLIICPRPLVTERKWQVEMKRFEERFTHLDGQILRFCIEQTDLEGVWPDQYAKAIIPYSQFDKSLLLGNPATGTHRRCKGLFDLDPSPHFDLVIVDEAHHIRNPKTYSHQCIRFFCDHAEAVLFLTATPIQLGSDDLFVLLSILRPDLIIDKESFEHMAAPNPYINRAIALVRAQKAGWQEGACSALAEAASTSWGRTMLSDNPEFKRLYNLLEKGEITIEKRVVMIKDLERMHTFSGLINRTRRRDIGNFTIRKPETVIVNFTDGQRKLHDDLLRIQALIIARLHGDLNVKFMMTTIRRQAASCLFGLAPLLHDILNRRIDELTWQETDDIDDYGYSYGYGNGNGNNDIYRQPDTKSINNIQAEITDLLTQAENLDTFDPKLETLRTIIRDKQELLNNKIMVFSSFRHTLNYLLRHLKTDGFRVGLVHGGTPDDERVWMRNRFSLSREEGDALDVLLFSEVGCEGLDYQFCDCIVNYDLPWNPMKIEQRIGRIDRKGQRSETVVIFNLITPGTVDADIYERCLLRIGVFTSALGGSEEILGQITTELHDISENLNLTEEQRQDKLQQIADNHIRLIREQEELEEKQVELFGIRLPEKQTEQEIKDAASYWLSPVAIKNLVALYLQMTCGQEQEYILGEKPLKTLRLSQEARNRVLKDFQLLPKQISDSFREWETWLKGGNPHLSITFEASCAMEYPKAAFLMPLHPLVRQAATAFEPKERILTAFTVEDGSLLPGNYPFVIYQWQFHGLREDLVLCPVCQCELLNARLTKLMEKAEPVQLNQEEIPNEAIINDLDSRHYHLWVESRKEHQEKTRQLAEYRKESLTISHRAHLAMLHERLTQVTEEKIQRMQRSRHASAEADYSRRIQEIDLAITRADITAQPVAFGIVKVKEIK